MRRPSLITPPGYCQALLLNYEEELVETFGEPYSLAQRLRFPVFLGAITPQGLSQALESLQPSRRCA